MEAQKGRAQCRVNSYICQKLFQELSGKQERRKTQINKHKLYEVEL